MKLKDQVAVVTGAGRNIGEEIAKLFAAEGAKVAVVDIDRPRGERVVAAIKGSGGEAELFTADVSKGSDVAALVRAVVDRFGRIDILVNNVAISDNKHIFDITEEEWDRVLAVTLKSQFLMGKHVAQQMAAQGTGGRIVNIGSTSGFMGRSRALAYSAAKGGVATPRDRCRTWSSGRASRWRPPRRCCSWRARIPRSSTAPICLSMAAFRRWICRDQGSVISGQ